MPSDMAYRKAFGSWGNALIYCGYDIAKPFPSDNCREAVSKAKKGKRGAESGNWKGGRIISNGYVLIWDSEKAKYIREHRKVMEEYIGRGLLPSEDVHHINGIKTDNRIENLLLLSKSSHSKLHADLSKGIPKRKNRKQCKYPNCEDLTAGKYGLCRKHYKLQWQRLRDGSVKDILDFDVHNNGISEESKERLRDLAKMQNRKNGKFSAGYKDNTNTCF